VIEAMTRADTSAGWSLMISSMLAAIAGAYLPDEGSKEVFQNKVPTCAGLLAPSGMLSPAPGGYRASGRWGFASGIRHAEWTVTCTILQAGIGGAPELRIIVVPVHEVVIEDTWHAAGLRGSGSEHYRMEDVFVPEARTFPWLRGPARRGGPAFDLPFTALLASAHSGFALGAARAALDALVTVVPARTKLWSGVAVGAHAGFHMDLGRAEAKLRAARALACEAADMLELQSAHGQPLSRQDWTLTRLSVTHATEIAAEVAKFAFHSAGSSALYESSPLQRLFRDVHAAAQHIAASDDAYEFAGRVLLGIDNPHPLLMARSARAEARVDGA
jgi:alkylation response protein AidB-like acyl-CoA dehydrogenase